MILSARVDPVNSGGRMNTAVTVAAGHSHRVIPIVDNAGLLLYDGRFDLTRGT
ncbi:MAG: hypothetical protein GX455_13120 [Phycisphaerae bacterium]|nr:hypothetical protein [Phycisphaerae bacterium]